MIRNKHTKRAVIIVSMPGDDGKLSIIYAGPYGRPVNVYLIPVTDLEADGGGEEIQAAIANTLQFETRGECNGQKQTD